VHVLCYASNQLSELVYDELSVTEARVRVRSIPSVESPIVHANVLDSFVDCL